MKIVQEKQATSEILNALLGGNPRKNTGRKANLPLRTRVLALHKAGYSIPMTATLAGCSVSHVKYVTAMDRSV
jgi:hypothetical protein